MKKFILAGFICLISTIAALADSTIENLPITVTNMTGPEWFPTTQDHVTKKVSLSTIFRSSAASNFTNGANIFGESWNGIVGIPTFGNASLADTNSFATKTELANVSLLNGTNALTGTNTFAGIVKATNVNNILAGSGTNITALTPGNLLAGALPSNVTVPDASLSANMAQLNVPNNFSKTNTFAGISATNAGYFNSLVATGSVSAGSLTVAGSAALTISSSLAAANLTGSIADARLSSNVPLLNGTNAFSGTNNFSGTVNIGAAVVTNLSGNGNGLTNLSGVAVAASGAAMNGGTGYTLNSINGNGVDYIGKSGIVAPVLRGIGHSLCDTLFANGGAPYSLAAAWEVPGGYSNSVAVLYTNGVGYYFDGGYNNATTISMWEQWTNTVFNALGYTEKLDLSCCVPGATTAHLLGGYGPGDTAYQIQDYVAANVTFPAGGIYIESTGIWGGYTNAILFADTNTVYVNWTNTSTSQVYYVTNPFYLGVSSFTSPTNYVYTQTNGGSFMPLACHGTIGAQVKVFVFSPLIAGYQNNFAPPYSLNAKDNINPSGTIGPMNYLITNSPASNGIPADVFFLGIQNEWSGGVVMKYFPDPTYTNFFAQKQVGVITNAAARLKAVKYGNVFICTEPMGAGFSGVTSTNGVSLVCNIIRTSTLPVGVRMIDLQASNATLQASSGNFIDSAHPTTTTAGIWASNYVANATGLYFSISAGGLGRDAFGFTNINSANISTSGSSANQVLTSVGGVTVWTNIVLGTVAADNVAAGIVGEYTNKLVSSSAAISISTAAAANVTNMTLAAGDWEVSGHVSFALAGATTTAFSAGINTTSATLPTDGSECYSAIVTTVLTDTETITVDRKRINVNTSTTVYLIAKSTFSVGTETVFGSLTARRIR